jgi:hypothetical protein
MAPQQPQILIKRQRQSHHAALATAYCWVWNRQETPIEITYEVELFIVSSESLKI